MLWLAALGAYLFLQENRGAISPSSAPSVPLTPTQFVLAYYQYAKLSQVNTGVPALVTLAQAGLESGWGKHAPRFNFFGMKPGSTWKGEVQKLLTWECGSTGNPTKDKITDEVVAIYPPGDSRGFAACANNGKYAYRTRSSFRAYSTAADAFADHGRFLRLQSRYAAAFPATTPEKFARDITRLGYASSTPGYADTVISTMNNARKILAENGIQL